MTENGITFQMHIKSKFILQFNQKTKSATTGKIIHLTPFICFRYIINTWPYICNGNVDINYLWTIFMSTIQVVELFIFYCNSVPHQLMVSCHYRKRNWSTWRNCFFETLEIRRQLCEKSWNQWFSLCLNVLT